MLIAGLRVWFGYSSKGRGRQRVRGMEQKGVERISDFERFTQQNLTPVPFSRGVACVLDCENE